MGKRHTIQLDDEDSPPPKQFRRNLWISLHFRYFFKFVIVDFFYFFLIVTSCSLVKGLCCLLPWVKFFLSTKDLQLSPSWNFLLPSYLEAEAHVMTSMISPPNIKKHVRYGPSIRFLVDDEAIKWGRSCLLNWRWIIKSLNSLCILSLGEELNFNAFISLLATIVISFSIQRPIDPL